MTATIAALALFVSLGSLVIALRTYRRSAPRIVVEVRKNAGVGRGGRTFVVRVVNAGHQASTVWDVGLKAWNTDSQVMIRSLRANHQKVKGPKFGTRIEGMDYAEWEVEGVHPAQAFGETTPVRGVVEYIESRSGLVFKQEASDRAEFNASPDGDVVDRVLNEGRKQLLDRIVDYSKRNLPGRGLRG